MRETIAESGGGDAVPVADSLLNSINLALRGALTDVFTMLWISVALSVAVALFLRMPPNAGDGSNTKNNYLIKSIVNCWYDDSIMWNPIRPVFLEGFPSINLHDSPMADIQTSPRTKSMPSFAYAARYVYSDTVTRNDNLLRISAYNDTYQTSLMSAVATEPRSTLIQFMDSFGNSTHHARLTSPHSEFVILSVGTVRLRKPSALDDASVESMEYDENARRSWSPLHLSVRRG